MDALKDRVGGFTECALTMACPVLVAFATKKVDWSSQLTAPIRHAMSSFAAISLFPCALAFISLGFAIACRTFMFGLGAQNDSEHPQSSLELWILVAVEGLLYLSAIGQAVLASIIFFVIITVNWKTLLGSIALLAVFFLGAVFSAYKSIRRKIGEGVHVGGGGGQGAGGGDVNWWKKKLEQSLDLCAAVTSLLFLGLEGLALEGKISVGKELNNDLATPVGMTFFFCLVASAAMLMATVPPMDRQYAEHHGGVVRAIIHLSWAALGFCFAAVVALIVVFLVLDNKEGAVVDGILVPAVPSLFLLLFFACCWLYIHIHHANDEDDENELKPASLEMTKVTFGAFLAISLPSFRGPGHLSSWTRAFIYTSAASVVCGLGWRFFSHFNKKAAVWTSKFACVLTHACLAVAAILLLYMSVR